MLLKLLVFLALTAPALALDLNVAWTPATPGKVSGANDPISTYQLFECATATCPAPSTTTGWTKVADFPPSSCTAGECSGTFTRGNPPAGGVLTLSYFLVARSTAGITGPASNVVQTQAAGQPTPPSAPGNLRITFVPLQVGSLGRVRVASGYGRLGPREQVQGCFIKKDNRS